MEDYLDKIQPIRGLVVEGTPDSLNKAIDGLDQLREVIIRDQVTISFDDSCSVVSDFSRERENKETSSKRVRSQAEPKQRTRSTARR